jgi:MOSC domain-containing protein YiiM
MQLTLMNSRVVDAIAGQRDRWPLAGDQLYVDLELASDRLPAGTRLRVGDAEIEVTAEPHTGCGKFIARFGADAMRWVNGPDGRQRNLRGINARVVSSGTVRTGDAIRIRPTGLPTTEESER